MLEECKQYREKMIEAAAEADEELLHKYLAHRELTDDDPSRPADSRGPQRSASRLRLGLHLGTRRAGDARRGRRGLAPSPIEMPP
jgi:elongation factor G